MADALPFADLPETPPTPVFTAPTIAYESELVTIYHGRSEHVLPAFPKETIDLIVTDPPYGVDWQSNRRTTAFDRLDGDGADAASRDVIRQVIEQCTRVVRQHRHLYVFGPKDVLEGLKVAEVIELVWDKVALGSGDVTSSWAPSHEMLSFTVSKYRHAGKTGATSIPTRLRRGSVLSYPRPTGRKVRHPSEKPVPLIRELLESSSRQGETVLDPFGGTCSTAVAAVLTGRRAVIVESDRRWVDLGIERVKAAERLVAQVSAL